MIKYLAILAGLLVFSCTTKQSMTATEEKRIPILIDSDANNELDDQHALAYAFANQEVFRIEGITVNNTRVGNGIQGQYDEAMRILRLFNEEEQIPLYRGATGSYDAIAPTVASPDFDGHEAVDFIIEKALKPRDEKLVLVPVGKLTNIALALKKAPEIAEKVRVVWLGSNYPRPGEYNLENDTTAINPVLESGVPIEMVVVRYGETGGSHAVSVSKELIHEKMKGRGVKANKPVTGRHGGEFSTFGDYSINLFDHIDLHGDPPSRALYDMVALAVIKNPAWGELKRIPPARLRGYEWETSTSEKQNAWIWENFKKEPILNDFFDSIERSGEE